MSDARFRESREGRGQELEIPIDAKKLVDPEAMGGDFEPTAR